MSLPIPDIETVTNYFPDPYLRSKDYVDLINSDLEIEEDYTTLVNTGGGISEIKLLDMSSYEYGSAILDRTLNILDPVDTIEGPEHLNYRMRVDIISITDGYTGPPFSGDSRPFEYQGQMVYPQWDGEPHESTSSFTYFPMEPWDTTVTWDSPLQREYSVGVDRGMLYLEGEAYPWSGLIAVTRDSPDGEINERYLDGQLYDVRISEDDYKGSMEVFTYPQEFEACIGRAQVSGTPLRAHGQSSKPFHMIYRTMTGTGVSPDSEYTIHILYNCYAVDTGISFNTNSNSPNPEVFKFDIYAVPTVFPGIRPTAYYSIDSRDLHKVVLDALEKLLYGADGSDPQLPEIDELVELLDVEID